MNHLRTFLVAVALVAISACQPKTSQVADSTPAIATVNGNPITRGFYDFYIKAVTGKSSADITPPMRSAALDNLIRAKVVSDQATKDGLDKDPDTAYRLQLAREEVLEQAVQDKYLKDRPPTEQEVRAEYETQVGQMPKLEYHTRNILVATEPFAEKVIARLEKGEKFEDVAKSASMDPSKNNGGDIPFTTPDRMPPPYAAAVIALKPGEYTHKAVQTQFGWHVIQLVETRDLAPPPFEQVKNRLEQMVQAKKARAYMDDLVKQAKVEKTEQATAPAAAPAAGAASPSAPASPAPAPSTSPTPTPAPASGSGSK